MKILILGLGNSGKSTFARDLGKLLPIPVYHLDRMQWGANWKMRPNEEFRQLQKDLLKKTDWIYEGFKRGSVERQVEAADVIVYLHASRLKLTLNWFDRLYRYRKQTRPDMADGNVEKFNLCYLKWLWKHSSAGTLEYVKTFTSNKELIVIRTESERINALKKLAGMKKI